MPSPSHHSTPSHSTHSFSLCNVHSKALPPSLSLIPFVRFSWTLYHVFFPQNKRSCFVSLKTMGKIILYPAFSILEYGEDILKFIVIIIIIIIIIILASKWALFTSNLMFLWPCIMNWPYKTTNVMHWILFIRQILLLSSTCFEYQVLIFRRT